MMASTKIGGYDRSSPNEFYDSAIELLPDEHHHSISPTESDRKHSTDHLFSRNRLNESSPTFMSMLLDQIDASSSGRVKAIANNFDRSNESNFFASSSSVLRRHSPRQRHLDCTKTPRLMVPVAAGLPLPSVANKPRQPPATLVPSLQHHRNNHQHQHHNHQQVVLTSSSPLRSSRSFTASYCPRPNVTVIRRKSASERLAESKSKYIRRRIPSGDAENLAKPLVEQPAIATQPMMAAEIQCLTDVVDHHHHQQHGGNNRQQSSSSGHQEDLVQIQVDSNRAKNLVKKRISPKLSESSATSNLEIQLRELLLVSATENGSEKTPPPVAPKPVASIHVQNPDCDQTDVYRAELKYIGSSSSSSASSIFSEPYNVSSSPDKMNFVGALADSKNQIKMATPQTPSVRLHTEQNNSNSDETKSSSDHHHHQLGRLLESLCLDRSSEGHHSGDPNPKSKAHYFGQKNYCSSSSIDSGGKEKRLYPDYEMSSTNKSSSNDFDSSIDESASHFSMEESTRFKNNKRRRKSSSHSRSTSKLTFENLMLHQQNLASSRSCTNLIGSLHTGPSVVERNARIIKWLFNCRKAMDHSASAL